MARGGYGETEPFLASGARATSGKGGGSSNPSVVALFLVPYVLFCIVAALFSYSFSYHSPWWTSILCCGIGLVSVSMIASSGREQGVTGMAAMGFLCLIALLLGASFGLWNYEVHMGPYRKYDESREYTNVLPSEPAAAFMDAGKIHFAEVARVDVARSVGYKHGDTYCVAPIKGAAQGSKVEFWAVGQGCCGGRRDFRCDDASDPNAHGALALMDQHYLTPSQVKYYQRAVRQAEASFDLVSASEPLFVRWVADPDARQAELLAEGQWQLGLALVGYAAVSLVFAAQASFVLNRK